jgi:hypothetical protein
MQLVQSDGGEAQRAPGGAGRDYFFFAGPWEVSGVERSCRGT